MAFVNLDMDGSGVNLIDSLFAAHNAAHGTALVHDDMTVYEIDKRFDTKTAAQLYRIMNAPGFFLGLKPYPGAIEAMRRLADSGHHVEVCTAPPLIYDEEAGLYYANHHAAQEKIRWLAKKEHVPKLARHVTLTHQKDRIAADALIDDYTKYIVSWCRRHPRGVGYLVDRPWNRDPSLGELPPNAIRCATFEEAVERAMALPLSGGERLGFPEPPKPSPSLSDGAGSPGPPPPP